MKKKWMRYAAIVWMLFVVPFVLGGCTPIPPDPSSPMGVYAGAGGEVVYTLYQDGSMTASVAQIVFSGEYLLVGEKLTVKLETERGEEVQTGTLIDGIMKIEVGGGYTPLMLTRQASTDSSSNPVNTAEPDSAAKGSSATAPPDESRPS